VGSEGEHDGEGDASRLNAAAPPAHANTGLPARDPDVPVAAALNALAASVAQLSQQVAELTAGNSIADARIRMAS
jgi:hypothetical protein